MVWRGRTIPLIRLSGFLGQQVLPDPEWMRVLVVRHGRIVHIRPAAGYQAPGWMTVLDGRGRFLMPGDLEGSPALSFAPLPASGRAGRGSLYRQIEERTAQLQLSAFGRQGLF